MLQLSLKLRANPVKSIAYLLIVLAIGFGFFSRVISVFRYTTFFYYDQIRDAYVYMKMWQGVLPTLGPSASVGGYSLPPLYYYLIFPFTLLGADPAFQALPNALFSFLSIPLLMYLVYLLLENIKSSKRLLLAGLAGFWYSLLFVEIFIGTFHWNPSPIPFFIICFTLLYKFQIETKLPIGYQVLSWLLYGAILAILISLHSSTMFVIPVVFIASSAIFIIKNIRKNKFIRCLLPSLSIFAAVIALLPYWKGEMSRGWSNSREIFIKITNASNEANSYTVFQRIGRALSSYFELGQQAYFIGFSWWHTLISIIVFSVVVIIGIMNFRGNKNIFLFLLFTWLLYLYAASNYWGMSVIHNKFIILFSPLILAISSLAYLDFFNKKNWLVSAVIIVGIVGSILVNIKFDYKYLSSKYGQHRIVSTADIIQIFNQLPPKSTICDPKSKEGWILYNPYKSYTYIDTHITQKKLKFVESCQPGNYMLLPKFEMLQSIERAWPVFTISNQKLGKEKANLFLESPVAYVYILE